MWNALPRLTFVLLLVAGSAGLFALRPPQAPPQTAAIMALFLYGPLLLMGLLAMRLQPRPLIWLCLLLPFYFCGFVLQAFEPPPARYWGLLQILLSAGLFIQALIRIRGGPVRRSGGH